MTSSPERVALEAVRVFFVAILCLIVPVAGLFVAFAARSFGGMLVGLVPLGGALWLISAAPWPSGARVGASSVALVGTIVYSALVVSAVINGLSG